MKNNYFAPSTTIQFTWMFSRNTVLSSCISLVVHKGKEPVYFIKTTHHAALEDSPCGDGGQSLQTLSISLFHILQVVWKMSNHWRMVCQKCYALSKILPLGWKHIRSGKHLCWSNSCAESEDEVPVSTLSGQAFLSAGAWWVESVNQWDSVHMVWLEHKSWWQPVQPPPHVFPVWFVCL